MFEENTVIKTIHNSIPCKINMNDQDFDCIKCTTGLPDAEVEKFRAAFPMLNREVNGHPWVYFNSAATALKPEVVLEAMDDYYRNYGVNVFRGVDTVSYRATEAFEAVRESVANLIGAKDKNEIVFTRGTTSAINLACNGYVAQHLKPDSEIVISVAEHHANYIPWQQLAKRTGTKLVFVDLDQWGRVTEEALRAVVNERTAVVALAQISNVMGAQNDLPALAKIVHQYGNAVFVVDGAQGIVHEQPTVAEWDIDFYAFSGHKLYGPTGVGVLYGKTALLEAMQPIEFGGEMIDQVSLYDTSFAKPPYRFEAGTPMIAEVIGLGRAIALINEIGYEPMQRQVCFLAARLRDKLLELPNVTIYNPNNTASGIVSFNIEGVHAHDAASVFDRAGISLRAGQHCNQATMDWLCQAAVLRASLAYYNTEEEVDYFVEIAKKAGDFLDVFF